MRNGHWHTVVEHVSPIVPVEVTSTEPAAPPPPPLPLGEVQRLSLKPGDIIVYEVDAGICINDMQGHRIKEQLEHWFPGHQVVVIADGQLRVFDETEDPPLPV